MMPHNVDFTFAFGTTLILLEMTKIWPEYVAQAFFAPPPSVIGLRALIYLQGGGYLGSPHPRGHTGLIISTIFF